MPTPPPPKHARWQPGQSGNPSGRKKGIVTHADVAALFGSMWAKDLKSLEQIAADPKRSAGEKMIASVIINALKTGDSTRINFYLDRMVGKPKEVSEVSVKNIDEDLDRIPRENIVSLLKTVG